MEGYGCLEKWGDPNFVAAEENKGLSDSLKKPLEQGKVFDEINFDGEGDFSKNSKPQAEVLEEIDGYAYKCPNKWGDDGEEETLSLSDLPISTINGENHHTPETHSLDTEDFNFDSWGGSILVESEMCAADEVFFRGQILPLRHSVSSESGVRHEMLITSRTESMERSSSSGGVTTISSSRSNSTGSHNSTLTSSTTTTSTYKPKIRNQFHSHPSPKPQIISNPKPTNLLNHSRKSTIWGMFKVGLVRTPEIELQNKRKSVNSRSSSTSSSRKSDVDLKTELDKNKKNKAERFLFEGCKCSVDAVETIIKKKKMVGVNGRESKVEQEEEQVKEKNEKQRKQALYHLRTFEWLKELSIADVLQET